MKDRVSTQLVEISEKPGKFALRHGVYNENGVLIRNEYIAADDDPIEVGTPLNKANLLTDETADSIGDDINTPNEAFAELTKTKAPISQPNFMESNVTEAELSADIRGATILGSGWSGNNPYTHTAGNSSNLVFPCEIINGETYEIVFTQTGATTSNFLNIIFSTTAPGTTGQVIKNNVYWSTTYVIQANNNYSYLNIIPTSTFAGTFTMISVKKFVLTNSETININNISTISKLTNYIVGNGGKFITSGTSNVATGYQALFSNTSASSNVAMGSYALLRNVSGSYNIVMGLRAAGENTTGSGNVAIGSESFTSNANGNNNVAVGFQALYNNTLGSSNIAIGPYAGNYNQNTNPSESIYIGYGASPSGNNQTNQIVIGNIAVGNGSNTITLGNQFITQLRCQVTTITALSDKRVKENISLANLDMCYEAVKNLPVTRYKYKNFAGTHLDSNVTGFMADDVEKVFPKSVTKSDKYFPVLDENGENVYDEIEETTTNEDGTVTTSTRKVEKMFMMKDVKDITMTEAIPTLWGAVQKLMERVEQLENMI